MHSAPMTGVSSSAIYDPVNQQMIVFGSFNGYSSQFSDETMALALTGTENWSYGFIGGSRPSPRGEHTAVYDSRRQRMLVFGGYGPSGDLNDVWELSLTDPMTWLEMTPSGTPPPPMDAHSAIYDPARDRMIVFSGWPNVSVWSLKLDIDPPQWEALHPAGVAPSARSGQAAIFDPVRDRMVMFGGAGSGSFNDVWALDLSGGTSWSKLTPNGVPPSPRFGMTAVFDPDFDRMLVYGAMIEEVWELSLANPTWTMLAPTGPDPQKRSEHVAIVDPVKHRMVMFGGAYFGLGFIAYSSAMELSWTADLAGVDPAPHPSLELEGLRPNPALGDVFVSLTLATGGPARIELFDPSGRRVAERSVTLEPGRHQIRLDDTAALPTGLYFVRVTQNGDQRLARGTLLR